MKHEEVCVCVFGCVRVCVLGGIESGRGRKTVFIVGWWCLLSCCLSPAWIWFALS